MKYQVVVKTFSGGSVIRVAQGGATEMTEEDRKDVISWLTRKVNRAEYLELNGTVVPGEFLKTRCVVYLEEVSE